MTLFCALTVTPRALWWGRVQCTEEVTAEEAVEEATDTMEEATEAEAEEATEEAEAGEAVTEQVQQRGHSIHTYHKTGMDQMVPRRRRRRTR